MLGGKNGIHTWMVDLSLGLVFHLKCEHIPLKFSPQKILKSSPQKNPMAPQGAPVFGSHRLVVVVSARRRHSDLGGRSTRFGDCLFQSVGLQAERHGGRQV